MGTTVITGLYADFPVEQGKYSEIRHFGDSEPAGGSSNPQKSAIFGATSLKIEQGFFLPEQGICPPEQGFQLAAAPVISCHNGAVASVGIVGFVARSIFGLGRYRTGQHFSLQYVRRATILQSPETAGRPLAWPIGSMSLRGGKAGHGFGPAL